MNCRPISWSIMSIRHLNDRWRGVIRSRIWTGASLIANYKRTLMYFAVINRNFVEESKHASKHFDWLDLPLNEENSP